MEAEMEQIRAGIAAACRKNVPRARIHSRILHLLLLRGAEEIWHVPHGDRGSQGDRAVDGPVAEHEAWLGSIPKCDRKADCNAGEDGINQRCQPQLSGAHHRPDLAPVRPSWNVYQVVRHDDYKLCCDEAGEEKFHLQTRPSLNWRL